MAGTVLFERRDRWALITLNRPDAANGINPELAAELAEVAARCGQDKSLKAVVLTGSGRFFSAGGDVKAMAAWGDDVEAGIKRLADDFHRAISSFARMPAPLIVAVNGVAAGGGLSLAAIGDLVLAADSATFTMAYTRAGLSPDGGSTWYLPRVIGVRRTAELMLTNRTLSAAEAADWGLVTEVVGADDLPAAAAELAERMAAGAAEANAAVKRLLLTSFEGGLETQMELESVSISARAGSPDGREGITAFAERRKPNFD